MNDLRFAVRQLRRSPGFTVVVVLTLALGIGATTAIFTLLQGVLLRPLPYAAAERIVTLWSYSERRKNRYTVSTPDFRDWRAQSRLFDSMARLRRGRPTLLLGTPGAVAESVDIALVSEGFFPTMGASARAGRLFDGGANGDEASVVVSERFVRRHFAGDPARALGTRLKISGVPRQVVGVVPPGFDYPPGTDVWAPLAPIGADAVRSAHNNRVVARLRPGVSLAQARTELAGIGARLAAEHPENQDKTVAVRSLHHVLFGDHQGTLWTLFVAVGLVLLIACANIANLLLARGERRRQEMAVRAALGAGRSRLARQLLTESLVLASAGGLAGVLAAHWGLEALLALAPADIPRLESVRVDGWSLVFACLITGLVCLLVGALPAVQVARTNLIAGLRAGARAVTAGRGRLRSALVVGQLAVSLVLLTGAGLLLTSLQRLATVEPGYRPENLLVVRATHDKGGTNAVPGADPKRQRDAEAARTLAYFEELRQRAAQLPGVEAVSFTDGLPVDAVRSDGTFWIEGRTDPSAGEADVRQGAVWRLVGPDYFSTIGVPVREGRQLDRRDRAGGLRTVVINRAMAESSWPGRSPIGARIRCGWYDGTMEWMTIVGVVADSHHRSLDEPIFPELYVPALQHPVLTKVMKLVMRTEGNPTLMAGAVQRALREVDSEVPMQVTTAEVMVAETLSAPRFRTLLLGLFAVTALLLALVGVAGVMGYMVSERRVEIGVRLAIGARAETILKHFVMRALRLTLIGLLLGLAGALAAARLLEGLLFGVTPSDPIILAAVSGLLVLCALAAAAWPALSAARTSPMVALQAD